MYLLGRDSLLPKLLIRVIILPLTENGKSRAPNSNDSHVSSYDKEAQKN